MGGGDGEGCVKTLTTDLILLWGHKHPLDTCKPGTPIYPPLLGPKDDSHFTSQGTAPLCPPSVHSYGKKSQ